MVNTNGLVEKGFSFGVGSLFKNLKLEKGQIRVHFQNEIFQGDRMFFETFYFYEMGGYSSDTYGSKTWAKDHKDSADRNSSE